MSLHVAVIGLVWLGYARGPVRVNRLAPPAPVTSGVDVVAVEPVSVSAGLGPEPVAVEREPTLGGPRRLRDEPTPKTAVRPQAQSQLAAKVAVQQAPVIEPESAENPPPTFSEPSPPLAAAGLKAAMFEATKRADAPAAGGGFGSMEMLLKERRLERALTWVFPKVISHDRSFWQWPLGNVGTMRFTVELSEAGRIVATRFSDPNASVRLKSLIERMTLFLRPGRFITGGSVSDGPIERHFELVVTHQRSSSAPSGEQGDIERLGFDSPEAGRPGRGYIVDTTGQELVAVLRELGPEE